ncbi:hypothetical protein Cch01nite_04580 [Cellulomonas chitinilytica]|uniref:Restriction endonuclease type II-like domain-containing protein n=1 Tax=Cellulomonas chitinilytica TaxID=398759 RepID=A0A919U129_9CELL|nr:hypothetical protein [Cellulomonas chitinilytica]GIG19734.1 hypothetical protein Cch01nite_04580 [Cellulomonas chitinilytica]
MTVPARTPGTGPDPAPATEATTMTDPTDGERAVSLVVPPSSSEILEGAIAGWRAALVEAAGGSTLVDVELLGEAALDLTAAHPSGMAQLFAGRATRLSNLVREGAALSTARRRARAVGARAAVYAHRYGIAPTSLAIGVATWTERTTPFVAADDMAALASVTRQARRPDEAETGRPAPRTVRAPVLLRPVTLRARGTGEADYELALEPSLEVNPVLARALRSRGALLDPGAVARGAFTGSGFDPRGALQRLASLGDAVLEDFTLTERVVVGTFVHPGQVLVDDLDNLTGTLGHHELVAALAGVDEQRDRLRRRLPPPVSGDRDPGVERGVGDLDPAQQHVLDVLSTGTHLFVDAPAGSDVTGTLAAVVADAAASGRTVLYVPGHRRAATALSDRLDALGLGDLLLDVAPEAGWRSAAARRLLGAMTLEAPTVDVDAVYTLRARLVASRERLRGYVDSLHVPREPWRVSAYDALQQLARLTSTRPAPRTTVRLDPDVARLLDEERRAELAADLVRAGELGAFKVRPTDTPWYGADLRTPADADVVVHRLDRLLDGALPALVERTAQVAAETGLTQATSLATWTEQLRMLDGVRGALDDFLPIVFERTAADLVAATATPQWREERGVAMGFWLRRRLRKQAKDMVRPGRPVADLHTALLDVQAQREVWQAHCPAGGWPRLPDALEQIEDEQQALSLDVQALDEVLATTPAGADLASLPFDVLVERLTRLRADTGALETLPARTGLLHRLRAAGLGPLVDDLATRRVDPALSPAELDLAWWSTVIEQILTADPSLTGYDGTALGGLSAQYAALDRQHVASLSGPVLTAVVGHVSATLRQHREQAESLFAELVEERLTSLRDTFARHPDVARRLRPVIAASPMLVPQVLPATRTVDLVVLDSAGHLSVEMALAAIARGRQVVVIGDARCASGSAVKDLADVLPTVALQAGASRRDPYLTAFLAAHGYAGVLVPTPLPQNTPLVRLDVVDGTGMPDASGAVASTRTEVEHVVELVLNHALLHPDESLAVVTPSPAHAEAVREAVLSEVRGNPALAAFFDSGRNEPFAVTDLAGVSGLRREAIILSLGYGRTPHRRVLHTFGPISEPGGDALLLDALGASRHRLVVVACFGADDLDPERVRGAGPRLLRDLLDFTARRGAGETGEDLVAVASDDVADATPPVTDRRTSTGSTPVVAATAAAASSSESTSTSAGAADAAVPAADGAPLRVSTGVVPVVGRRTGASPVVRVSTGVLPVVGAPAVTGTPSDDPDRLLLDLAERLWRHGLVVEVDHGIPGGTRIPMVVGHPDAPGELLVAVLTDDDAYVAEPSIRVRERLMADRLERLGWSVLRVWSAAAFLDPQAEVDRIRRAVHARVPAPAAPRTAPLVLGVPDTIVEADEPDELPAATGTTPAATNRATTGATPAAPRTTTAATPVVPPAPATGATPAVPSGTTGAVPVAVGPATGATPVVSSAGSGAHGGVATTDGPADGPTSPRAVQLSLAVPTRPRPDVRSGLPIGAYSDDQLDEIVAWLVSDGEERTRDQLGAALRKELGITRRSYRVDTAVRSAITRALR